MSENQKNYLVTAGIDLNTVINYTGDLQMYHEILLEFYEGLDEQFNTLKNSINDLSNYAILVHALKSNARTLGLTKLADAAYEHELASKAGNVAFVNENIKSLENIVVEVKTLIGNYKNL
ncbi:MAG: Hpt domain-containing protein [Bacilli bacterium]|nr:Hpt domain-containing protein [Bacilli bacterium]